LAMKLQHELERQVAAAAASKQTGQTGIAALQQLPQNVTMQAQLDACMTKLEDFVDELSEIGCELKDYQMGLIDFVGRHDGRDVYLCWKLGEEKITHWHDLETGFAGRKPVSTLRGVEVDRHDARPPCRGGGRRRSLGRCRSMHATTVSADPGSGLPQTGHPPTDPFGKPPSAPSPIGPSKSRKPTRQV